MSSHKEPDSWMPAPREFRKIDLAAERPDPIATSTMDGAAARRLDALPVRYDGRPLLVAMADPNDAAALDEIAATVGIVVEPVQATKAALIKAHRRGLRPGRRRRRKRASAARPASASTPRTSPLIDLHEVLGLVLQYNASDLHLTNGLPPMLRIDGDLVPIQGYPAMEPEALQRIVYGMLSQKQREKFEENLELDFSYSLPGKARFRVNVYQQRGALGAAFRLIPFVIKTHRGPRPAARHRGLRPAPARTRRRHRPDRLREVDVARRPRRRDQPRAGVPHHDRRGPDRVPPRAQDRGRQPARGRHRHPRLRATP